MAILLAEHFDGYTDTAGFNAVHQPTSTSWVYAATDGRFGGGCATHGSVGNTGVELPLRASPGSNMIRCAFWFFGDTGGATTGTRPLISFKNSASDRYWNIWWLSNVVTGTLHCSAFDDANATAALVTSNQIPNSRWVHVEICMSASTSTGVCQMWINGELQPGSISSGDTSDAVSGDVTAFDRVRICGSSTNSLGVTRRIDDFIVWDDSGTFTGAMASRGGHRLYRFVPTANGGNGVQWTPLSGSNYQNVDDASFDGDTSYVEAATIAFTDYYVVGALGITLADVMFVAVENITKIDTGTHTVRNKLDTGSVVSDGATSAALTTTYRLQRDYYELDPDTAAAWVQANIEAAQFGMEMVS